MTVYSCVFLLHRRLGALLLLNLLSISQLCTATLLAPWASTDTLVPWGGETLNTSGDFLHKKQSVAVNASKQSVAVNVSLHRDNTQHLYKGTEVNDQNISQTEGKQNPWITCTPANTIFDFGFYDGADSDVYLVSGFCVVGVEADPDLVAAAQAKYPIALTNGQLRLLNAAIAPSDEVKWTKFYRNKCSHEWNSFFKTVGCRTCNPPYSIESSACDEIDLKAMTCGDVLKQFGMPIYFKLDIEGAETGCFEGMASLGDSFRPTFLSAEITELSYLDSLHELGYTKFKLMRQDKLMTNLHSRSGPWGENAWDCRTGQVWRTYEEAHSEMTAILSKKYDITDPCSGGVCPIHQKGCEGAAVWYDVHAMYR